MGRWLKTGDAARMDDEGFVYIVDRWKDMYISGGENVYPAEIENVLYQLPEVAEAAIIGVPNDKWGEVGLAVLALKPGATLDRATVSSTASRDWRSSRCRTTSPSSRRYRATPPARCSSANCERSSWAATRRRSRSGAFPAQLRERGFSFDQPALGHALRQRSGRALTLIPGPARTHPASRTGSRSPGVSDSGHLSVWTLVCHVLHPSTPVGPSVWMALALYSGFEARITAFLATSPIPVTRSSHPWVHDRPKVPHDQPARRTHCRGEISLERRSRDLLRCQFRHRFAVAVRKNAAGTSSVEPSRKTVTNASCARSSAAVIEPVNKRASRTVLAYSDR